MRRNTDGKSGLWGIPIRGPSVVLLLSLLLLAGLAAPVGAVISQVGPRELLLDPVAGRLYTYLAYDNRILAMDVESGQLVSIIADVGVPGHRYEGMGIRTLALDEQAGRLFAINSVGRGPEGHHWTLFGIDAAQGTIVQQIPLGVVYPYIQLLADPAHGKLYAVGETDTVVYDTVTLTELGTLPGGRRVLLDREGGRLYLASDESVAVINTADDAVLAELSRPEGYLFGMAVDPTRRRFYLALPDAIHVLDTASQQWLDPLTNVPSRQQYTLAVDPADGELYVAGESDGAMTFHVFVLLPETRERKLTITFQEPTPPEGVKCSEVLLLVYVNSLMPIPAGGLIYGSGNAMSRCRPEAHLAFVLDTEAETLVEWLPRLPWLPETGGQWVGDRWLLLAGIGLLLFGILASSFSSART